MAIKAFNSAASYTRLFHGITSNNVNDVYSMDGPGAFYVALLDLVKKHITPKEDGTKLTGRRPDLYELAINPASAGQAEPYLQTVVAILQRYLDGEVWPDISLGENSFIPYSRPLARAAMALKSLGVEAAELSTCFCQAPLSDRAWALAELGLSAGDYGVLQEPNKDRAASGSITPAQLMRAAAISEQDLSLLVYNGASGQPLFINTGKTAALGLKQGGASAFALEFVQMDGERHQRIRIMLTLAGATGWTYSTLNALLIGLGITEFSSTHIELFKLAKIAWLARMTMPSDQPASASALLAALKLYLDVSGIAPLHKKVLDPEDNRRLAQAARKLGLHPEMLWTYLKSQTEGKAEADDRCTLDQLLELVRLRMTLERAGMNLSDYIAILCAGAYRLTAHRGTGAFLEHLRGALIADLERFGAQAGQPARFPEQLTTLLTERLAHELAVHWGMAQGPIVAILHQQPALQDALHGWLHDPAKAAHFVASLENLLAYAAFLDKLAPDQASLAFLGGVLLQDRLGGNGTLPRFDNAYARQALSYQHIYQQIDIPRRAAFMHLVSATGQTNDQFASDLAAITRWPLSCISDLLAAWTGCRASRARQIETIDAIAPCQQWVAGTGLASLTLRTYVAARLSDATQWAALTASCAAIEDGARQSALHDAGRYRHHLGGQLEQERTRLLPVVLARIAASYTDITSHEHLSDYFLCDVDMAGHIDITPLREATDAVQTYLMRCKNGLENVTFAIPADRWEWMANFRLWQAEQKLATYPENYLQADLLQDASDNFNTLKDALLSQELSDEIVDDAIHAYLERWRDQHSYQIVDLHSYQTPDAQSGTVAEVLAVIARSASNTYYHRKRTTANGKTTWDDWQEIGVKIGAETVSCVYAFNRLNLFWTRESAVSDTDPSTQRGNFTIYSITIEHCWQTLSGGWTDPAELTQFPYHMEVASGSALQPNKSNLKTNPIFWKKPVLLPVVLRSGSEPDRPYLQLLIGERGFFNSIGAINEQGKHLPQLVKLYEFHNHCGKTYTTLTGKGVAGDDIYRVPPLLLDHGLNIVHLASATEAYGVVGGGVINRSPMTTTALFDQSKRIPIPEKNRIAVHNHPDAFGVALGEDFYLFEKHVAASLLNRFTIRCKAAGIYVTERADGNPDLGEQLYDASRITFSSSKALLEKISNNGLQCLDLATQEKPLPGNVKFSLLAPKPDRIRDPDGDDSGAIHFSGATGRAACEIFFHIPMLVAALYTRNLQFEKARQWHHKVFNPQNVPKDDLSRSWQYLPFKAGAVGRVTSVSPALAQATDGALYFAYISRDDDDAYQVMVAVSYNQGKDWSDVLTIQYGNWSGCVAMAPGPDNQMFLANDTALYVLRRDSGGRVTASPSGKVSTLRSSGTLVCDRNKNLLTVHITATSSGNETTRTLQLTRYAPDANGKYETGKPIALDRPPGELLHASYAALASDGVGNLYLATSRDDKEIHIYRSTDCGDKWIPHALFKAAADFHSVVRGVSLGASQINGATQLFLAWRSGHDSPCQFDVQTYSGNSWRRLAGGECNPAMPAIAGAGEWQYLACTERRTGRIKVMRLPDQRDVVVPPATPGAQDIRVYRRWAAMQYIRNLLEWADNEFRQETWESLSAATRLYFEADDLLGPRPAVIDVNTGYAVKACNYSDLQSSHFQRPSNAHLHCLWDTVADRLYKIRHGLNINGEVQPPAMDGVPLDPASLLRPAGEGGIATAGHSELASAMPLYRFRALLPATESMIEMVLQFGGKLYGALQQKDAEQLQLLQSTHQAQLQQLLAQTYQLQIDEAEAERDALTMALRAAEDQARHYQALIDNGWLDSEQDSLISNTLGAGAFMVAAGLRAGACAAHMAPTIFGLANGGMHPGSSLDSSAQLSSETAMALQATGQVQAMMAEHQRRDQEWALQLKQAELSIEQTRSSLAAAVIRVKIAHGNMRQYELSLKHTDEIQRFLTNKFTNTGLYHWISGQLSSLYFTAYQLALGALHQAQRAYRYELDLTDANFIPAYTWNGLRKGLLAGETLKLALARMQDSYFSNNKRRLEIEKIFSLKMLVNDDRTWENFLKDGKLTFNIQEKDLASHPAAGNDLKIKTVMISIPAVMGPYDTFDGVLTCDDNGQQIVISRGIDDMGIFQQDADDGRYLPFEGSSAISAWSFSVDKAKAARISDVILTLRFTARPGGRA